MNKVTLLDIKQALLDHRFRDKLPLEIRDDVVKFLGNPGCACNRPLFRRILRDYKEHLKEYFPNKEIVDESEEITKLAQNNWSVINCHIDDLENKLKKLSPGRKQLELARFENQVTVVVNELEAIF